MSQAIYDHAASIERLLLQLEVGARNEPPRQALYRALITRPAGPFAEGVLEEIDRLYRYEAPSAKVVDAAQLPVLPGRPGWALWLGDITTLRIDAIVNAANDALLGCFAPFHRCIDNAIHAAAGPRLRLECAALMMGRRERTGAARVTGAYHLPSRYVIHTVGPIVSGDPSSEAKALLTSSYRACLDAASAIPEIRSIAFCAISTGVFGFPADAAARIALRTVDDWRKENPARMDLILFDLFSRRDFDIYTRAIGELP